MPVTKTLSVVMFPKFTYGVNLNLQYKGFELGLYWTGSSKVQKCISGKNRLGHSLTMPARVNGTYRDGLPRVQIRMLLILEFILVPAHTLLSITAYLISGYLIQTISESRILLSVIHSPKRC